jgi:hypothetical protein
MSHQTDENELRALFEEIDVPASLDRWRDRVAAVVERLHDDVDSEKSADEPEPAETNGATVMVLPTDDELRPVRQRTRAVAVAAAAAVIVGLGAIVITTQLLGDDPPADPTMIIDGPDNPVSTPPVIPSKNHADPSGSASPPVPESGRTETDGQPNGAGETVSDGGPGTKNETPSGNEASWPAMVGDPTAANTGVPLGASLGDHYGDLRITTAGQVVKDVRVTGTIVVDAPNVTLLRVLVVPPSGAAAVRQNAGNLTVENSELSGSLTQGASGLVVRRSRLQFGVTITSGAELYDSYLDNADVLIPSGSTSVLLRHNVMGRVTMNDLDGPIRGVSIENSLLNQLDAPTRAGSASIHVLGNRFRGNAPSTGWNPTAPDYQWSNNTFADNGAPANP